MKYSWLLAAVLAVTIVWIAGRNFALHNENRTLRSERQLAEVAHRLAQHQLAERTLLAEKMITDLGNRLRRSEDLTYLRVTSLYPLVGSTWEAQAIAVWNPGQQTGLLVVENLPVIAESQDYQIWIVDPAYPEPVSGGVFHVTDGGKAAFGFKPDRPVTGVGAFTISIEKKGGAPKAEGPVVLQGK